MTKDDWIHRWIDKCEPKNKSLMIDMLQCLTNTELMRYFFVADSKSGLSAQRISIKYGVGIDLVKYHIKKSENSSGKLTPDNK